MCARGPCGPCPFFFLPIFFSSSPSPPFPPPPRLFSTIESLATAGKAHPVSQAFVKNDAQQCGYCTPGFVMAAKGYLDRNPAPTTEEQAGKALGGNLCRCGTYVGVRKAVLEAAKAMKGAKNA